jgi:nucleoside triphosphate diphosphatase
MTVIAVQNDEDASSPLPSLAAAIAVMASLRTPETGCPWDLEQTFQTIAPYTIEEAYEVSDAIHRGSIADFKSELGDLLFQVLFQSRIAEEKGLFSIGDVAQGLADKMISRHPHVFGDQIIPTAEAQLMNWETLKAQERAEKIKDDPSVLADVPLALPALMRAEKLTKRAARVGFDWATLDDVMAKLAEEIGETREAIAEADPEHIAEEIGDVLFVVSNLARKLKVDPEQALRGTNAKFERRFRWVEAALRDLGKTPEQSDLAEMDALWNAAKVAERSATKT